MSEPWQPFPRRAGQNRWHVWHTRPGQFVVIRAGRCLRAFATSRGASRHIKRCELLAFKMAVRQSVGSV